VSSGIWQLAWGESSASSANRYRAAGRSSSDNNQIPTGRRSLYGGNRASQCCYLAYHAPFSSVRFQLTQTRSGQVRSIWAWGRPAMLRS
jgi:hypothetical protein